MNPNTKGPKEKISFHPLNINQLLQILWLKIILTINF
jgi:hypothetical protein